MMQGCALDYFGMYAGRHCYRALETTKPCLGRVIIMIITRAELSLDKMVLPTRNRRSRLELL